MHNNLKEQDYIMLKIVGRNDSMFEVEASYAIAGFIANGWINKCNKEIGVYSRAYSGNLNLYKYPEIKTEIQCTIKEYTTDLLHIKDCQNNWLLIDTKIDGNTYEGWIEPNMQCANPYSTCN